MMGLMLRSVGPIVLLTALAGSPSLWSGTNQWTGLGPEGGSIQILVVDPRDPGTVYATSNGASFKSTDAGIHWKLTNFPVGRVVIGPPDTGTLYVATWGRGIFKSTDDGATWNAVNLGLPDIGFVSSLVTNRRDPNTLYASVAWNTPSGSRSQIFKSANGGENWTAANSGLPDGDWCCDSLEIDHEEPDTLYRVIGDVESCCGGLYKSTDGGETWTRATAIDAIASAVDSIVIDPRESGTVYAVACKGSGESCFRTILKSVDRGANWSEANSGLPEGIGLLAIDPQNPRTLYATSGWLSTPRGLYKTTDGGASWSAVAPDLAAHTLAVDSRSSSTLYAGTAKGVLKSTDGGASWSGVNSGLAATNIVGLAIAPGSPSTIYSTTMEDAAISVSKSADGGASWTGIPTPTTQGRLSIDPFDASVLYMLASTPAGGIFKSTDGGASWKEASSGLEGPAYSLALDPINPGTAYASTGINVTGLGIFKTMDGAASWHFVGPGPASHPGGVPAPAGLALDPQNPMTLYALSITSFSQLSKSTDGGVTFGPANSGLPTFPWGGTASVVAFVVSPQNSGSLYAWIPTFDNLSATGGLFKSVNGGDSWEAVIPGLPDGVYLNQLVIDSSSASTLYVGTSQGVLKSTDEGASWSAVNAGLTTLQVNTLTIDPQNTRTIYAGTSGGGVFVMTSANAIAEMTR